MHNSNQFLHIRGGKVLFDEKNICNNFLEEIDKLFLREPESLTEERKSFYKAWVQKMFNRSKKGDIEGNYRYHWLLTDALEIYFNIKGLWYLGPKKSLRWIFENDIEAYNVFNSAYKINVNIKEIETLIEYIVMS